MTSTSDRFALKLLIILKYPCWILFLSPFHFKAQAYLTDTLDFFVFLNYDVLSRFIELILVQLSTDTQLGGTDKFLGISWDRGEVEFEPHPCLFLYGKNI